MNPHLGQPVVAFGADVSAAAATTVLVHGRNQSPDYMLEIARRLQLPEMAYLAPAADENSWYPLPFLAPLQSNEPRLGWALDRLDQLIAELLASGRPRRRVALVGFSQGACLACEYVRRNPGRWGALIAFTGGFIGPPGTAFAPHGGLDGTPMFFGVGDKDEFVPADRVRETARVFQENGAATDFRVYPGRPHGVADDEIAAAREILVRITAAANGVEGA